MRHSAAHPPPGPTPPPGTPPGPYDPPSQPPPQQPQPRRQGPQLVRLGDSSLYPGLKSFKPLETCRHGKNGTPVRAIISHR